MSFSSTVFLFLFLPITLLVYYNPFFKTIHFRNGFLFFASIFFYAWGEPLFVLLMLLSICITYILGLLLTIPSSPTFKTSVALPINCISIRKVIIALAILYHLGVLFAFKYLGFFAEQLNLLLHTEYSFINLSLPIGISFFTFQMLSYLFDVYYGRVDSQKSIIRLGLYVSLFPQLIAGPIVRYSSIINEINFRKETWNDFLFGLERFVIGLAKKALLADYLGEFADRIFYISESGNNISALTTWIGAMTYTLQIYYDFSGYSDMAIGLGKCFGFHITENFNYPYIANSIQDFWKRWHISLTDWFRDYVYIPLGGNRVSISRNMLNICIVWLLTGIWHGANWTYVLWGIIYCLLQLSEKFIYKISSWPKVLRHIYTMLFVTINWVVFRSTSVKNALSYISIMFGRNGFIDDTAILYLRNAFILIFIAIILAIPIKDYFDSFINNIKNTNYNKRLSIISNILIRTCKILTLIILLLLVIIKSISGGYSPFIYFNF